MSFLIYFEQRLEVPFHTSDALRDADSDLFLIKCVSKMTSKIIQKPLPNLVWFQPPVFVALGALLGSQMGSRNRDFRHIFVARPLLERQGALLDSSRGSL